jgi:hypothetical protein
MRSSDPYSPEARGTQNRRTVLATPPYCVCVVGGRGMLTANLVAELPPSYPCLQQEVPRTGIHWALPDQSLESVWEP